MKTFIVWLGSLSVIIGGVYYNSSNINELTALEVKDEIVQELKKDNPEANIYTYEDEFYIDGGHVAPELIAEKLDIVKVNIESAIAEEEVRLADEAARADCRARLKALKHPNRSFYKHFNNVPNRKLRFKRKCLDTPDMGFVELMESEDVIAEQEAVVQANVKVLLDNAKDRIKNMNCALLTGFVRDICIVHKGM